ncbi:response regulator transcription factor [Planctomycetes bacterium K23_9]|uniref:Response regulator protein TodT n=1 Tax=Stieleria marina TaxID=1930275 RepID=A0A517NVD5_9BACT|nr:Response regulator protein TodT [Planctomycetes bacterium K23_9]
MNTLEAQTGPTDASESVVYVVDDDPLVLSAITESLRLHGYAPRGFAKPSELLARVSPSELGCVVSDLRMPTMDGVQLQRELKILGSDLSLIVLTAYATVPVAVRLMKDGAVSLLEKPFDMGELAVEVGKAIRRSQQVGVERKRVNDARKRMAKLTSEELAVLDCAAQGKPNKMIGQELSLSSRTVDRRRHSALSKLAVESVSEFVAVRARAEYPSQMLPDERESSEYDI